MCLQHTFLPWYFQDFEPVFKRDWCGGQPDSDEREDDVHDKVKSFLQFFDTFATAADVEAISDPKSPITGQNLVQDPFQLQ